MIAFSFEFIYFQIRSLYLNMLNNKCIKSILIKITKRDIEKNKIDTNQLSQQQRKKAIMRLATKHENTRFVLEGWVFDNNLQFRFSYCSWSLQPQRHLRVRCHSAKYAAPICTPDSGCAECLANRDHRERLSGFRRENERERMIEDK